MGERSVKQLTDPRALRALAHPLRLELVRQLAVHGAMTATQAAGHLGQSSGSTSFHLRQLAKYGLVEDAGAGADANVPGGPQRCSRAGRLWPTAWNAAASGLLSAVVAKRYIEWLLRWLERREDEPAEWRAAAHFGDSAIYVTAQELNDLHDQEQALMDQFLERLTDPESRPPGARRVYYLHLAFPDDAPDR